MNRRTFWSVITGGLIGTRLDWFKDPSRWWASVDMAGPTADVVGLTSDIDLSVIDLEPLIKSFKKFTLETEFTTRSFDQIRKDITASPVFLDLEEDDD